MRKLLFLFFLAACGYPDTPPPSGGLMQVQNDGLCAHLFAKEVGGSLDLGPLVHGAPVTASFYPPAKRIVDWSSQPLYYHEQADCTSESLVKRRINAWPSAQGEILDNGEIRTGVLLRSSSWRLACENYPPVVSGPIATVYHTGVPGRYYHPADLTVLFLPCQ